jgi:hypothetical protein
MEVLRSAAIAKNLMKKQISSQESEIRYQEELISKQEQLTSEQLDPNNFQQPKSLD